MQAIYTQTRARAHTHTRKHTHSHFIMADSQMNILHSFFSIATPTFASPKLYYLVEPTRSWNSHSEAMEL